MDEARYDVDSISDFDYPVWEFNAVKLSPAEVAKTFVPPPAFRKLVRSSNALLIGPRGSGKTTLLKMMLSEALENWGHEFADEARRDVRSTGVFVGADRLWTEQISQGEPVTDRWRSHAAYSLHIGQSLLSAMEHRAHGPESNLEAAHLRVTLSSDHERALCERFARLFRLRAFTGRFETTRYEFEERLVELGAFRSVAGRNQPQPSWAALNPLKAVEALANQFNAAVGQRTHKWSLLFDELELAPEPIVKSLFSRLRGNEPRLTYKLSLFPAHRQLSYLGAANAPMPGQDFDYISLTYPRKKVARTFMNDMLSAQLARYVPPIRHSAYTLLGASTLDNGDGDEAEDQELTAEPDSSAPGPYEVGSPFWLTMKRLSEQDSSFQKYLVGHEIDLDRLESMSAAQRASRLRKIRSLVVVRDAYAGVNGRRSRKTYEVYTGADSVLTIPDGNPRMGITLFRELFPGDTKLRSKKVSPKLQSSAIDVAMERFLALLRAQDSVEIGGRRVGLLEFLDEIGDAIATNVIDKDFRADVQLTFRVDRRIRREAWPLLQIAINTGAIIHLPERGDSQPSAALLDRRYRLSYLLSPRYKLPLRLGPPLGLSSLLAASRLPIVEARPRRPTDSSPTLFDRG